MSLNMLKARLKHIDDSVGRLDRMRFIRGYDDADLINTIRGQQSELNDIAYSDILTDKEREKIVSLRYRLRELEELIKEGRR